MQAGALLAKCVGNLFRLDIDRYEHGKVSERLKIL